MIGHRDFTCDFFFCALNIHIKKFGIADMKKFIWGMVLLIWALLAALGHAKAQTTEKEGIPENQLYAQAAVLIDADSGRVLYGKNEEQILAMASTTKIMTCIIALENGNQSDLVEISSYAASMPEVKLGVRKGESYRLEDLLYSLMLESHNDVAVAIAEHIGKHYVPGLSEKKVSQFMEEESKEAVAAFVNLMNEKSKALGCENTYFITPNGLDGEETVVLENGEVISRFHSTTAEELALIMSYCIKESSQSEMFLKITQRADYSFVSENGRSFFCTNHNAFLNMMDGVVSGKTGFTNRAGYCYVGALEKEGRTFAVALLACGWPSNKTYKWADCRKLFSYGLDHYRFRSFYEESDAGKWKKEIPVLAGQTDRVGETAYVTTRLSEAEGGTEGLLMKEGEKIKVEYELKDCLQAPVAEGDCVGQIRYVVDEKIYCIREITAAHDVKVIDWQWCLEQIFDAFYISTKIG